MSNALLFSHSSVGQIKGKCKNKICIPFHKYQFEVCLYFPNGILDNFFPNFLIPNFPNFQIYGGCFSEDRC